MIIKSTFDFQQFVFSGFWNVLDWIYPPVCASCSEPGYRLCPECFEKIKFLLGSRCDICGGVINEHVKRCRNCKKKTPPYDGLVSLAIYDGVMRDCIHALKYDNNQSLGDTFSKWLVPLVHQNDWGLDMVTPVPLSAKRYRERGYNQSSLIARPLAARLHLKCIPFAVRRIRHTPSQVGLSAEERRLNVIGAFKAEEDLVIGKRILLVDDVMTTGATISSCAKALHDAGASAVYCITLARYSPQLG